MQYLTFFTKGKISLYNIGLKNEKEKKLEEKIFRRGDFNPKSVAKKGYTPVLQNIFTLYGMLHYIIYPIFHIFRQMLIFIDGMLCLFLPSFNRLVIGYLHHCINIL